MTEIPIISNVSPGKYTDSDGKVHVKNSDDKWVEEVDGLGGIEMITLRTDYAISTVEDGVVAAYCKFQLVTQSGVWNKTYRFEFGDGHISVDVDKDDVPIGVQWINIAGIGVKSNPVVFETFCGEGIKP